MKKLLFATAVFFFAASSASAQWTAPTQSPPSGNANAPINTSGTTQTKSGSLVVGSLGSSGGGYFLGSFGLGTTSPNAALHIFGSAPIIRIQDSAAGGIQHVVQGSGGVLSLNADTGNGASGSRAITFSLFGSEQARVHNNGYFGIGVTSPQTKLHVQSGTSGDNAVTARLTGSITTSGTDYASLELQNGSSDYLSKIAAYRDGAVDESGLKFYTKTNGSAPTEAMRITKARNVGIGTTTPGYLLTVGGDINFTGTLRQNGAAFSSGGQWVTSGNDIYNSNSGNVGIGTVSPTAGKLQVVSGSGSTAVISLTGGGSGASGLLVSEGPYIKVSADSGGTGYRTWGAYHTGSAWTRTYTGLGLSNIVQNTSGAIDFQTDTNTSGTPSFTSRLFVKNDGNVGIGTTNPTAKLDVRGGGITDSSGTGATLRVSDALFMDGDEISVTGSDLYIGNSGSANKNLHLGNNFKILSGGNVGVGDASPTNKLDVTGAIGISDTTVIDASRNIVNAASVTSSGQIQGTNFRDGTGSYNVNLGSGGTEGRGLVAGYSGGSYGGIGYNVRHTAVGGSWVAPGTDTSSYILFTGGGFAFYGAPSGTAGRSLSYTTLMNIASNGNTAIGGNATNDGLTVNRNWFDNSSTDFGGGIRLSGTSPSISFYDTDNTTNKWMIHNNSETLNFYRRPSGGGWDQMAYFNGSGEFVETHAMYSPAFYYSSDRNLKENIQELDGKETLGKVLSLEGVSFDWKKDGKASIGLIAQDVEKVYPEIVTTNEQGLKSVQYGNLVAPLIEAVKEQQRQIDALKAEVAALKAAK